MNTEERARLRRAYAASTVTHPEPRAAIFALLDEVDRLTEALEDVQGLVREWEQIRCGVLSPGLRKAAADLRLRGVGDAIKAANDEMKRQDYADWLNRAERAEADLAAKDEQIAHLAAQNEQLCDDVVRAEMSVRLPMLAALQVEQLRSEELAADLADEKRRRAETTDALATLVQLKDGTRDDTYRAMKEAAWDKARALLSDTTTGADE